MEAESVTALRAVLEKDQYWLNNVVRVVFPYSPFLLTSTAFA